MERCNFGYEDRPSLQGKPYQIDMSDGGSIGLVYVVLGVIIGIELLGAIF